MSELDLVRSGKLFALYTPCKPDDVVCVALKSSQFASGNLRRSFLLFSVSYGGACAALAERDGTIFPEKIYLVYNTSCIFNVCV